MQRQTCREVLFLITLDFCNINKGEAKANAHQHNRTKIKSSLDISLEFKGEWHPSFLSVLLPFQSCSSWHR